MDQLTDADPARIGPYTLLGRLGTGSLGTLYLGRSAGGRTAAVKLIRPDLAADTAFRARFAREVAAARAASGAFTAPVLDADTEAEPPWLATAFVPGIPLQGAVAVHGPLPAAVLLALTAGIAEALAAIHAAGLVHCDLKPSNVLLALDGPYVVDFGIARFADATDLTEPGAVSANPAYLAPERIRGGPATAAGDVFSLGAVLAFAARGASPFAGGDPVAVLRRVLEDEPDLADVPDALRLTVAACLAKDPADRPTPRQLVDFVESGAAPAPAGPWLPPGLIAAIEAEAAAIAPIGAAALPRPPATPPTTPEPLAGTVPTDAPPGGDTEPAPPRSRRALLLALGGGAAVLAGGGTALALLEGGGSSHGKHRSADAARSLTRPDRDLGAGARDATPLWTAPLTESPLQILGDGHRVVAVGPKHLWAFDGGGHRLWGPIFNQVNAPRFGLGGMPAAIASGRAVTVGYPEVKTPFAPGGSMPGALVVRAFDLDTGHVSWTLPSTTLRATSAWIPGALGTTAYLVTGAAALANRTDTWAVDTDHGRVRWHTTLDGTMTEQVRLSVPGSGHRLLRRTTAVDFSSPQIQGIDAAKDGAVVWRRPAPGGAPSTPGSQDLASPWHDAPHSWAAGRFLVLGERRLDAVDPADGQTAWHPAGLPGTVQAVAADPDGRTVYAAGPDYRGHAFVRALDARTGKLRWAGRVAMTGTGSVALQCADATAYLWANGTVWALRTADGTARWKHTFSADTTLTDTVALWAGSGLLCAPTETGLAAVAVTGHRR